MIPIRFVKILVACLFLTGAANAQIYIDPAVAAATAVHAGVMNNQLDNTNDKLTAIQRGQLAVTGQLTIVNDLQDKLYKGLSEVAGALRSLLAIKDIADISTDIIRDVEKAIGYASDNPALLLFAESGAREFKTRAANLAADVTTYVMQGGTDMLMDAGERAKLLNNIRTELTILRGVAFGMQRSMFWAKQRGILASLNPYGGFINIDKQIATDIVRNSKLSRK